MFFGRRFFYDFLGIQKSTKNRKKAAQNRKEAAKDVPKAKFAQIWGRPCGMCGAAGGEEEGGASNIMRFDE